VDLKKSKPTVDKIISELKEEYEGINDQEVHLNIAALEARGAVNITGGHYSVLDDEIPKKEKEEAP